MLFWNRKPRTTKSPLDDAHLEQVEKHKQLVEDAISENKAASAQLKQVFERNHFTVKIAIAMGAKQQPRGATGHGR